MKAQRRIREEEEEAGGQAVAGKKGEHEPEVHRFLTPNQMRQLLKAMKAARDGDFTARLPIEDGLGEIAEVFNEFVGLNQSFSSEIVRVSKIVAEEGRLTERAGVGAVAGSWKTSVDSINVLINALAQPTTEVGRVITAVAEGDLSKKMMMEIEGRPLRGGVRPHRHDSEHNGGSAGLLRIGGEQGCQGGGD